MAWLVLLAVRWLVFRVEVGAGMIKLRGDPCWRDLICLRYHQDDHAGAGPFNWRFHHLPAGVRRSEALGNHVVQLDARGCCSCHSRSPRRGHHHHRHPDLALASGNFAGLNLLTIVLAAALGAGLLWLSIAPIRNLLAPRHG